MPASMTSEIDRNYDSFYAKRDPDHVYPVEFVVRAFLGSYPRLKNNAAAFAGQRVLDLGFGDGRNMPLLSNLGMHVHGVEISEEICARTTKRMQRLGVSVDNQLGRNCAIPFEDRFFDQLLACHSCYYVDPGSSFDENLREISRVMKPGARFVFSAPIGTGYILRGAKDLGGGHMEIANDPYGIRNGYVFRKFDAESEIEQTLAPWFGDFHIGACRNDFWGIEEHVWTVVCTRL
jgi:SAM-dependent methyltransferase